MAAGGYSGLVTQKVALGHTLRMCRGFQCSRLGDRNFDRPWTPVESAHRTSASWSGSVAVEVADTKISVVVVVVGVAMSPLRPCVVVVVDKAGGWVIRIRGLGARKVHTNDVNVECMRGHRFGHGRLLTSRMDGSTPNSMDDVTGAVLGRQALGWILDSDGKAPGANRGAVYEDILLRIKINIRPQSMQHGRYR